MFRQLAIVALIALLFVCSEALCPAGIRIVNAGVPNPVAIDLVVNNVALATNVGFRNVTRYFSLSPGSKSVVIRQTSSQNQIATRSFVAVANVYYTIALTGSLSGPVGELLFSASPFIVHETIYPPNPGKYKGTYHAFSEATALRQLSIRNSGNNVVVPQIQAKTAVYYPEIDSGSVSFSVQTLNGQNVLNSVNQPVQFNTTLNSGILFDLFNIGDDSNTQNPTSLSATQSSPAFDSGSGCTLVDGIIVLPDNSPVNQVSFSPFFCSASTLATGIAFLLALVALFF